MQHCWPTTPNIFGFHSVHLFAHPVAGCCVLLNKVWNRSTTPQHSYLFCDRWSIVQQCWIRLHSLSNIVGDTHVHYTWSPKSCGLYPSHDALQVPTLLGVVASIAQRWELLRLFALSWTHITEHSKTSKWVLKLQFLTLRQDHKDPFTFMSETHLNPPSPPPPNPRLLNPRFLQMEGSKEKQSSGLGCSNMPESPIQWINH